MFGFSMDVGIMFGFSMSGIMFGFVCLVSCLVLCLVSCLVLVRVSCIMFGFSMGALYHVWF